METIILDTNFLIYSTKFKIDFFLELERICDFQYKIATLNIVIKELEKLQTKELKLIKKFLAKIEIIEAKESKVDKELINLSYRGYIIATQDKELKNKLKKPIILIRQKKYLEINH